MEVDPPESVKVEVVRHTDQILDEIIRSIEEDRPLKGSIGRAWTINGPDSMVLDFSLNVRIKGVEFGSTTEGMDSGTDGSVESGMDPGPDGSNQDLEGGIQESRTENGGSESVRDQTTDGVRGDSAEQPESQAGDGDADRGDAAG